MPLLSLTRAGISRICLLIMSALYISLWLIMMAIVMQFSGLFSHAVNSIGTNDEMKELNAFVNVATFSLNSPEAQEQQFLVDSDNMPGAEDDDEQLVAHGDAGNRKEVFDLFLDDALKETAFESLRELTAITPSPELQNNLVDLVEKKQCPEALANKKKFFRCVLSLLQSPDLIKDVQTSATSKAVLRALNLAVDLSVSTELSAAVIAPDEAFAGISIRISDTELFNSYSHLIREGKSGLLGDAYQLFNILLNLSLEDMMPELTKLEIISKVKALFAEGNMGQSNAQICATMLKSVYSMLVSLENENAQESLAYSGLYSFYSELDELSVCHESIYNW